MSQYPSSPEMLSRADRHPQHDTSTSQHLQANLKVPVMTEIKEANCRSYPTEKSFLCVQVNARLTFSFSSLLANRIWKIRSVQSEGVA